MIIPAYNEAETLADTIRSLRAQSVLPDEIIVVDDCSTEGTGSVARQLGVTVLGPPRNTGSKAGVQHVALSHVRTSLTIAIDADTTLAPDAIGRLMGTFDDPPVAAACGFVLPRRVQSLWERGRYIEYQFAFTFYKQVQDCYGKPLISSGCFSMHRTDALRAHGGWPERTLGEDMDLTWTLYRAGRQVRFIPEAVCYPLEPHNFVFMRRQLRVGHARRSGRGGGRAAECGAREGGGSVGSRLPPLDPGGAFPAARARAGARGRDLPRSGRGRARHPGDLDLRRWGRDAPLDVAPRVNRADGVGDLDLFGVVPPLHPLLGGLAQVIDRILAPYPPT